MQSNSEGSEMTEWYAELKTWLMRTVGPPTHFTVEELEATIKKVRDERLRREAEERRRQRK